MEGPFLEPPSHSPLDGAHIQNDDTQLIAICSTITCVIQLIYKERINSADSGVEPQYLSPLGWEHINLTGDYLWRRSAKLKQGRYQPLRPFAGA